MRYTKYKLPITSIRLGVVYQISLFGKIYIGITTQKLEDRIRAHIREALNENKNNKSKRPFVSPYDKFKGKNSAIKRLFTTSKLYKEIKALSKRKINKYLYGLLINKVTVLDEVRCEAVFNDKIRKWETDRSHLYALEISYIEKLWIDNPQQLLNYSSIPFIQKYSYLLEVALSEDIERLQGKNRNIDNDELITIIKNNRRSKYKKQLATINKEMLALNTKTARQQAIIDEKLQEELERDF